MTEPYAPEGRHKIGVVARMIGMEPVTLRAWESRYGVVTPDRSRYGSRLYSPADIGRLALVKRLVDQGHAISTVAGLSLEQLKAQNGFPAVSPPNRGAWRLVGLGAALPVWLQTCNANAADFSATFNIVAVYQDRRRFAAKAASLKPDMVLLEYPTLHDAAVSDARQLVRRVGAPSAVVVYAFGRWQTVEHLKAAGIMPLRAPLRAADLCRLTANQRALGARNRAVLYKAELNQR